MLALPKNKQKSTWQLQEYLALLSFLKWTEYLLSGEELWKVQVWVCCIQQGHLWGHIIPPPAPWLPVSAYPSVNLSPKLGALTNKTVVVNGGSGGVGNRRGGLRGSRCDQPWEGLRAAADSPLFKPHSFGPCCTACGILLIVPPQGTIPVWTLIGSVESSPLDCQESPEFILFLWGEMIRTQGWEGFVNPCALTGLSMCFNEKGAKTMQAKGSLFSATWLRAHRAAVLGDALLCYAQTLAEVKTTVI